MSERFRWARWAQVNFLILVAVFSLPFSALAQMVEADEVQRVYDPDIESQIGKTGEYKLRVKAIPFRLFLETADLNGAIADRNQARQAGNNIDWMTASDDDESERYEYEVIVPDTYRPKMPAGVMVFINAGDNGRLPQKYDPILKERNMIGIGANKSGNSANPILRQTLAIHAVELLARRYQIDPNRIYITGSSGGGRAASMAMYYRPDIFKGGCPMVGCTALTAIPFPRYPGDNYAAGSLQPGLIKQPSRDALREAARNGRYAILTGEKDFNRGQCEATAEHLQSVGFKHVTLLLEPGAGHAMSSAEYFDKAIAFMDAPLIEQAVKAFDGIERDIQRGRLSEAMDTAVKILPYLSISGDERVQEMSEQAKNTLAELTAQYDQAISAVEDAISAGDAAAAQQALRELQRTWRGKVDKETLRDLSDRVREVRRGGC